MPQGCQIKKNMRVSIPYDCKRHNANENLVKQLKTVSITDKCCKNFNVFFSASVVPIHAVSIKVQNRQFTSELV